MTAVSLKTVVATLSLERSRAKLGVILCRDSASDVPDHVESRRSPGMKKCCSWFKRGVEAAEELREASGRGGTGGTIKPGLAGGDLFVTPGMYAIWITFEARVKTVEAMEPTVCVEARPSRFMVTLSRDFSAASSYSDHACSSYCRLRFRMQNLQTMKVTSRIKATPPITPPAMAPTGGFEPPELPPRVLVLIHRVDGQELQFPLDKEQGSSEAH